MAAAAAHLDHRRRPQNPRIISLSQVGKWNFPWKERDFTSDRETPVRVLSCYGFCRAEKVCTELDFFFPILVKIALEGNACKVSESWQFFSFSVWYLSGLPSSFCALTAQRACWLVYPNNYFAAAESYSHARPQRISILVESLCELNCCCPCAHYHTGLTPYQKSIISPLWQKCDAHWIDQFTSQSSDSISIFDAAIIYDHKRWKSRLDIKNVKCFWSKSLL